MLKKKEQIARFIRGLLPTRTKAACTLWHVKVQLPARCGEAEAMGLERAMRTPSNLCASYSAIIIATVLYETFRSLTGLKKKRFFNVLCGFSHFFHQYLVTFC